MYKTRITLLTGFLALALLACSSIPSGKDRTESALNQAERQGWNVVELDAGDLKLLSLIPDNQPSGQTLTVFIEGDGLACISRSTPSLDPTPINPVGLHLALQFTGKTPVAYLGRPCQYISHQSTSCRQKYWTSHRFSPEVIMAESIALDKLKKFSGTSKLRLIGYSGGGGVATLLAAQRQDVTELITIAGNLDHQTWTTQLGISPLTGSLNPLDVQQQIAHIPQWHFLGEKDQIMPASAVKRFLDNAPSSARIVMVEKADHHCCWEDALADLFANLFSK